MVLAERSTDVRNGKRSRGPSPNGHGSPDSSSEDENGTKNIYFATNFKPITLLQTWPVSFTHAESFELLDE